MNFLLRFLFCVLPLLDLTHNSQMQICFQSYASRYLRVTHMGFSRGVVTLSADIFQTSIVSERHVENQIEPIRRLSSLEAAAAYRKEYAFYEGILVHNSAYR